MDDWMRFQKVMGMLGGKRLTFKELTGKVGETRPF